MLFVHVMATLARLLGPGGIRSVVAESVLVDLHFGAALAGFGLATLLKMIMIQILAVEF